MTGRNRAERLSNGHILGPVAALSIVAAGCAGAQAPSSLARSSVTLNMAFGLTSGQSSQSGARQAVELIGGETLLGFGRDARPQARLAESWVLSPDGRQLRVHLRAAATFHDGHPVTAEAVRDALIRQLPSTLVAAYADIEEIRAISPLDVELVLKRRSGFVLEGLADVGIRAGELPGKVPNNTGPFKVVQLSEQGAEMVANDNYYGGRPSIDRIVVTPYASVRAAWADMLRGRADMLYEVGPEALDFLQPSKTVRVISHLRNYASVALLNTRRPALRDPALRRALNAAIDRQAILANVFKGRGLAADGAVWPSHWAYDQAAPRFRYEPVDIKPARTSLMCIVADPAHERLALVLRQQLQRVGVDLRPELLPLDQAMKRAGAGDFDAFLVDVQMGPTLSQSYKTFRTGAPRNLGGYSNATVDAALDRIGAAATEDDYRASVGAFQRAIIEDPPALFIAWSERARAVSTRFDVPVEAGRDVLGTLRLWKLIPDEMVASRN